MRTSEKTRKAETQSIEGIQDAALPSSLSFHYLCSPCATTSSSPGSTCVLLHQPGKHFSPYR
jgi:hypothetical protein